jgi:thioredoxin-like negative regulator of GroEL
MLYILYLSILMPLPIITKINDRAHFAELLKSNPGLLIIKFGAEWCGPCKAIEEDVKHYFNRMPDNVQCAIIDVDESFDVYAFLKSKRMVNGIPAILAYCKGNLNYIPDKAITGSDRTQLNNFFTACYQKASGAGI